MKRILFPFITAALMLLASCTDKDYAAKMVGIYDCTSTAYVGPENAEIETEKERVTISRIDETTIAVKTESSRWGVAEFVGINVSDYDDLANFSGTGTMRLQGSTAVYDVKLSGSFNYDSRELAATLNVVNYGKRLIITFTNKPKTYQ